MGCYIQLGVTRLRGLVHTVCALIVGLGATSVACGDVELNVTRVGFPTLQRGDVVRAGAWVPIIVDLALLNQQSFVGSLRVGQFDSDGDECYDSIPAHLRTEIGGAQRLALYALANPLRNRGRFNVELFSEDGEAVRVVSQGELTYQGSPAQQPYVITDEAILILSLSSGAVGRLQELVAPDQAGLYRRPIHVAHMSPVDLPELWIGLEMVDYIVWDDARPEELTQRQVDALAEWARQGGTLMIAASRTAGSLRLTESINRILPVNLGEAVAVDNLPEVRRALLSSSEDLEATSGDEVPWWGEPFERPIPVVRCTLRSGAMTIAEDIGAQSPIIARRPLGRGSVIFSAVTLKDLLGAHGSAVQLFRELFHLSLLPEADEGRPEPEALFPHVVSAVGFARSGSLYLLVAGGFSVAYVFLATSGTWMVLGAKGWRQHE